MPHKIYHGKTGVVYNVTKSSIGVIIYKRVDERYIEKRVNLRLEHVSHSRSRDEFVNRVKANAELKRKSKVEGTHIHLKRQPAQPREARTVTMKENVPETVTPVYVLPKFLASINTSLLTSAQAVRDLHLSSTIWDRFCFGLGLGFDGSEGLARHGTNVSGITYHKGIRARSITSTQSLCL